MLDSLEHEEVALCRRVPSNTRGFEVTVTQLPREFWDDHGVDRERYYSFHRRRNSEFFFADYVILTESPIDAELIRHLVEDGGLDLSKISISIVSLDGVQSLPYAFHLLKELQICFATIVDKDYFLPYLHDELEKSRDNRGFPRYKKEYQQSCLLDKMIVDPIERDKLLGFMHTNHSRAMDILETVSVFCFRWSMEIDLIGSGTAQNILFESLGIQEASRKPSALLVDRRKALKKLETILPTVQAMPPRKLA